ncbi:MAG: FecR domain-containing protein, partial [Amphiplicatus sp.]
MEKAALMTNEARVVPLRSVKNDDPQAADWLAKLDRGDLSAAERAAFARWLAEDPRNKHAIKQAAALWYGLNAPLSRLGTIPRRAARRLPSRSAPAVLTGLLRRWRAAAGIGGVAVIAVIAYVALRPVEAAGYYATKIGETRLVSLADGSKINLNTNSIVEQAYSGNARVIRLISGEAIFDVAHDKRRPFVVYAANGVIQAVGTRFAVRVDSDKVKVVVTEGKIAFQKRRQENV